MITWRMDYNAEIVKFNDNKLLAGAQVGYILWERKIWGGGGAKSQL